MMETPENLNVVPDEVDTRPNISQNPPSAPSTGTVSGHPAAGSTAVAMSPVVAASLLDHKYRMDCPNRGIALIFNHVHFNNKQPSREGSDKDEANMKDALASLGFDVYVFKDLSKKELFQTLSKFADMNHSKNDCLVVVVMTHGEKNALSAKDKQYDVEMLWEPFLGDNCTSLVGKPKLFFLQACRGTKVDDGVALRSIVADSVDASVSSESRTTTIPSTADLVMMYSTFDGHYSFRNPERGSWFIQALCAELNANAYKKELLHLLTSVARRVAYEYQSHVPHERSKDKKKQMPYIVSTLTKEFYFTEKGLTSPPRPQ